MTRLTRILPAAVLLLPQAALAHPGHGAAMGMDSGFLHPLAGADHVLAMVAVGLLAALRGGRALWALPAAFLALMSVGAGLGMAGFALPHAETGVALSVVAFGLLAMAGLRARVGMLAALVGAFAVFHGYAHGAEMPETASGLAYGLGFLAATALLHAARDRPRARRRAVQRRPHRPGARRRPRGGGPRAAGAARLSRAPKSGPAQGRLRPEGRSASASTSGPTTGSAPARCGSWR